MFVIMAKTSIDYNTVSQITFVLSLFTLLLSIYLTYKFGGMKFLMNKRKKRNYTHVVMTDELKEKVDILFDASNFSSSLDNIVDIEEGIKSAIESKSNTLSDVKKAVIREADEFKTDYEVDVEIQSIVNQVLGKVDEEEIYKPTLEDFESTNELNESTENDDDGLSEDDITTMLNESQNAKPINLKDLKENKENINNEDDLEENEDDLEDSIIDNEITNENNDYFNNFNFNLETGTNFEPIDPIESIEPIDYNSDSRVSKNKEETNIIEENLDETTYLVDKKDDTKDTNVVKEKEIKHKKDNISYEPNKRKKKEKEILESYDKTTYLVKKKEDVPKLKENVKEDDLEFGSKKKSYNTDNKEIDSKVESKLIAKEKSSKHQENYDKYINKQKEEVKNIKNDMTTVLKQENKNISYNDSRTTYLNKDNLKK